jgi:Heterokaryon incompatibility protein (HET)
MYKPFTDNDQLRLLLIEPGHGVLRGQFIHTRLSSQSHSYESISYTCEPNETHQDVETSDGPLNIPRTLHDALLQLRDPTQPRYVWAEHACVDRTNSNELCHQARLTPSIFKTAERVVVWLGADAKKRAATAFAVLCGVASGSEVNGHPVGQANFHIDGASSANLPDIPCRDGPPPASFKMFWSAVAEMFGLRWFWDVCRIQEVSLRPRWLMLHSDCELGRRGTRCRCALGQRHDTVEVGRARGGSDSKQPSACPAAVWHARGVQRLLDVSTLWVAGFPSGSSAALLPPSSRAYQSFRLRRSSRSYLQAHGSGDP